MFIQNLGDWINILDRFREADFLKVGIAICAVIISGVLLFAAFPAYDFSILAWFAMLPLFFVLLHSKPLQAFVLSVIFGVVFYTGIFWWMFDLPKYRVLHHAVLGIYLTPLMGFFGLAFCVIARRLGSSPALLAAPFIWISLEYLRSNFAFLSLPWGLLAHSQYQHPLLIQIAGITGVYGISFLIVLVNSALMAILYPSGFIFYKRPQTANHNLTKRGRVAVAGTAFLLLLLSISFGYFKTHKVIPGEEVKVSLIQGNIEQSKKWDPKYASTIMKTYADLTQEASKEKPMLIVWPETATPRSITEDYGLYSQVKKIASQAGSSLLLGSSELQKYNKSDISDRKYFNSAFLINSKPIRKKVQRYDKIYLLPFGEYLPYKEKIPWSYIRIPDVGNYLPGQEFTIFSLDDYRFGVTICWENIFPQPVRNLTQNGAQFIVNITNEAWFGKTAAPYQFLSMSVFRAVENSRYIVRCGNTGISCIIDSCGRIVSRLKDHNGRELFIRGVLTGSVSLSKSVTFYTKFGDMIVYVSLFASFFLLIFSFFHKSKSAAEDNLK